MSAASLDAVGDITRAMGPVAREILGEPNQRLSSSKEWRYGSRGSLSIDLTKGAWCDHEMSQGGGVVDFIQHHLQLDRSGAISWLKDHGHIQQEKARDGARRRIVATYDYTSSDGKPLFQVVRYDPKDFRQRRPDRQGGWIWNVSGVKLVPYRLPNLLAADPSTLIFVVEGEKDVEALRERLLIATTNAGGAGKWSDDLSWYLCGRRVVILPDNDQAGEDHARRVARSLAPHCASVATLRLPDLPPKGDVCEWLSAGGTADELLKLAEAACAAEQPTNGSEEQAALAADLRSYLSVTSWAERDIPPPDRLLGDIVTTTSRMFLVGRTGLGKTNFAMAMAGGIATGEGFLHWRSGRPGRVLYIDGEMSEELLKARAKDVLRRSNQTPDPHNLLLFAVDTMEEFARRYPVLGQFAPLNTEDGRNFLLALIEAIGGADVVFLDNVMSLISGVQKEEEAWSQTLPLVTALTRQRMGQVWMDHTGHDISRQYGSSTKAWRMDTVGIMKPPDDKNKPSEDLVFELSFDPPGKARRRSPDNREDFAPVVITLKDDRWTATPKDGSRKTSGVAPSRRVFYDALVAAIGKSSNPPPHVETIEALWKAECIYRGLIEPPDDDPSDESSSARGKREASFRAAKSDLLGAGWILVEGQRVIDHKRRG